MKCTSCGNELKVLKRLNIEIDTCPRCMVVWLEEEQQVRRVTLENERPVRRLLREVMKADAGYKRRQRINRRAASRA